MSLVSLQNVRKFLRKTPEQRRITARFVATMWLAKLPYAPHRVTLKVDADEHVEFWWSYFPASFNAEGSLFSYWGDDTSELRFLWKFLQPGMTFVDIGAHHGVYTLITAKRLGRTGRVIAFEPCARDRQRLGLHLRANGISSVSVEPYALSAKNGRAELFTVTAGYTTMNSLRQPATDYPVEPIAVETCTLDGYLERQDIDKVDLMKIDAEGAEMEVFCGANRVLTQHRPLVLCEILDKVTRPWGYPARDIIAKLQQQDYLWFEMLPGGGIRRHSGQNEYPDVKNYLAVPREKQHPIEAFITSSPEYSAASALIADKS
jgi:FkbM family methyltransferase